MTQFDRLKGACEKARDVRQAQKDYFRTRGQDFLTRSKKLERELDAMLPDALLDDDMIEMLGTAVTVAALPASTGRPDAERIVTDVLPMTIGAIAVGGGSRKARVKSDGFDWRVAEWLDP